MSYSSENTAEAEALRSMLEQGGINVWMANRDIGAGEDFSDTIQRAIDGCSCFMLLLTEAAQRSPWVPKELDLAISNKKPIVPVQLKQVTLTQSFKFNLINTQIVTLHNPDTNNAQAQRLISTVKNYMDGTQPTAIPPKASAPVKSKRGFLSVIAIAIVCIILLASILPQVLSDRSESDLPDISDVFKENALEAPSDSDINQIPKYFENSVKTLKYADENRLNLQTKTVKTGEYISLNTTWTNAVIYSEDTGIAIGEGSLVKGVSPGTTYVVLATSKNVCITYRIIVEE